MHWSNVSAPWLRPTTARESTAQGPTSITGRRSGWSAVRGTWGSKRRLEPFALNRIDPQPSFLRVADRCIDGVPLFDAAFTGADGVRGRLGALGSDAEIAVAETEPFTLMEPQKEQRNAVAAARRSRHKAVILLTRGNKPGLFLLNASSFRTPCGPPMLQVSSEESEWLKEQAAARAEATVVAAVYADRDASLQRHREDCRQRSGAAAAGHHDSAQRLVAVRERARRRSCLLAGNDAGPCGRTT